MDRWREGGGQEKLLLNLMEDEGAKEFYLGINPEISEKCHQRRRRKKRWR